MMMMMGPSVLTMMMMLQKMPFLCSCKDWLKASQSSPNFNPNFALAPNFNRTLRVETSPLASLPSYDSAKMLITIFRLKISERGRVRIWVELGGIKKGMKRHKKAGKRCNKVGNSETGRSTPLNPEKPEDLVELKLCSAFLVKNTQSMSTTLKTFKE